MTIIADGEAGGSQHARERVKSGRPRLDDRPGFKRAFATLLPAVRARNISQGDAARQLGISVRSLKRYVHRAVQELGKA